MAAIALQALEKVYDNGFRAVRGIDLEIGDKEFMVLVGPSGCGKTTTLRMIAGLEEVSGGEVRIDGRRVNETAPKDRDIAMVFQSYALYPHMTVYENLAFALRLRKTPRPLIREKVLEVSRLLDLVGQLEKLPKALSGGQRQRVALGRAIVRQPKAYLFDEPLSNLDAKLRAAMRIELKTMQARLATTAVYVTHDQVEAMTLGDRITVMSMGEIQQVASPAVVYDFPCNRFVAGFIGTPSMNFIPARLVQEDGGWHAEVAGRTVALAMPEQRAFPAHAGQAVLLGVRPECLHTPATAPAGATAIPMKVAVVEHMGDHQYVHLRGEGIGETLVMKTQGQERVQPGEALPVHLETERSHIFAGTGEHAPNITLPEGFASHLKTQ